MKKIITIIMLMGFLPLCNDARASSLQDDFNDLSQENKIKAMRIANAKLQQLKIFQDRINTDPHLNLEYTKKLNGTLKQTSSIYIPPNDMTPEQQLMFLRAVNKRLKNKKYATEQEIARGIDQQLLDAQKQALELNALQGMSIPSMSGNNPAVGSAGTSGEMIKMASLGQLNIPAVPEMRPLSGEGFDSESSSTDEIRKDFVRIVAKSSRDFKSETSSQDALNSDIKEANRNQRFATNVQYGSSENAGDDDVKEKLRSTRTIQIKGMSS